MNFISRDYYLKKLRAVKDTNLIKVITGVRRSGKSTLLRLFRDELQAMGVSEERLISINFEDPKYNHDVDWYEIYNSILGSLVPDDKNYVFLDEVQYIPEFEKLLVGLQTQENVDLYVTGSNAHMLSSELATLLSGRSFEINMMPYSFAEFVEATKDIFEKESKDEIFMNYVRYGGFPQAVSLIAEGTTIVDDYLKGIYETIAGRDIMDRKVVTDKPTLNNIAKFLLNNVGNYSTSNSIADGLSSGTSHHTIPDYLSALTDSYLFYPVSHTIVRGKELLRPQNKYYAVDTGLRHALIGTSTAEDIGHTLENIVYFELLRRKNQVKIGKVDNKEIDFVAMDEQGFVEYYQVAWSVREQATLTRELEPLKTVKDFTPRYLITMDPEELSHDGIRQINAINWLLS